MRKEELCEFLAKAQVFTKDGKSGMFDPLDGTEKKTMTLPESDKLADFKNSLDFENRLKNVSNTADYVQNTYINKNFFST